MTELKGDWFRVSPTRVSEGVDVRSQCLLKCPLVFSEGLTVRDDVQVDSSPLWVKKGLQKGS